MTKITQLPADTTPTGADLIALVENATTTTKRMTLANLSAIMTTLLLPSGMIMETATVAAPTGWLICDGSAISRSTYATLFTALGTTYGTGDGSTTFNIPDLRGRTAIGVGTATGAAGATAHTLGQKVGEETHVLTKPEQANATGSITMHAQAVATFMAAAGGIAYSAAQNNNNYNAAMANTGGASSIGVIGLDLGFGGGAHNNMQPYLAINYIIKT